MAGRRGLPSSDDELLRNSLEEPTHYEFQSYLTDDTDNGEGEADGSKAAPDQAGSDDDRGSTLAHIASASQLLGQEDGEGSDDLMEDLVAHRGRDNGTTNGITMDESGSEYDDNANGVANEVDTDDDSDDGGSHSKIVDIEVRLDWMPPEERATYYPMDVHDEPVSVNTTRRLRRRKKVSRLLFAIVAIIPGFIVVRLKS